MGLKASRPPSGDPRLPISDCAFCQIATHGPVVGEAGRVVAFRDRAPAAAHHFLVVPNSHIASCYDLDGEDDDFRLLEEMEALGREVAALASPPPAASPARVKTGFHFPPLYSVDHLHLHVFVLPHNSWRARIRFASCAPWFATPAQVRARMAARKWAEGMGRGGGKGPPGARMA